jgi:hypothetical protein
MRVIQSKQTRNRSSEVIIWEGDRLKDAQGQIKQAFNSTLDMLMKHNVLIPGEDGVLIDETSFSIRIDDSKGIIFQMDWRIDGV